MIELSQSPFLNDNIFKRINLCFCMVEVTNKFENIPATDVYVDFGLEQIVRSNERFLLWAQHQAFLAGASLEEIRGTHFFSHLTVGGNAQTHDYILPESSDSVNWNIRFAAETDNGGLDNALSQEWRLRSFPSFSTFNSAPRFSQQGIILKSALKMESEVGSNKAFFQRAFALLQEVLILRILQNVFPTMRSKLIFAEKLLLALKLLIYGSGFERWR
jgi:hypothetical protein